VLMTDKAPGVDVPMNACAEWRSVGSMMQRCDHTGKTCTKAQVLHAHMASESSGTLLLKRTLCDDSNTCVVFKAGRCINVGENVWSSKINNQIADMTAEAKAFGEKAAIALKAEGEGFKIEKSGSTLKVLRGDGSTLLEYASASTAVSEVWLMTGWGSSGEWTATVGGVERTVSTPDSKTYGTDTSQRAFSGLVQPFTMNIAVTADNDATLFLSSGGAPASSNGYEIVLGGWRNTKSVIREGKLGSAKVETTGGVLCRSCDPDDEARSEKLIMTG